MCENEGPEPEAKLSQESSVDVVLAMEGQVAALNSSFTVHRISRALPFAVDASNVLCDAFFAQRNEPKLFCDGTV